MSKNNRNNVTTTQEPVVTQEDSQVLDQSTTQELGDLFVQNTTVDLGSAVVPTTTLPPVEEKKIDTKVDGFQLNSFQNRRAWLLENGTDREKHVIAVLDSYVNVCTTSIDLERIAIEQQRLWRLFEYIHVEPQDFRKLFTIVIEYAKEYRETAFDISMFFRAQKALNLDGKRLEAFNNVRTLIINTANTVNIKQVKSILDIRKIIETDAFPEHIRAQYVAFYE